MRDYYFSSKSIISFRCEINVYQHVLSRPSRRGHYRFLVLTSNLTLGQFAHTHKHYLLLSFSGYYNVVLTRFNVPSLLRPSQTVYTIGFSDARSTLVCYARILTSVQTSPSLRFQFRLSFCFFFFVNHLASHAISHPNAAFTGGYEYTQYYRTQNDVCSIPARDTPSSSRRLRRNPLYSVCLSATRNASHQTCTRSYGFTGFN